MVRTFEPTISGTFKIKEWLSEKNMSPKEGTSKPEHNI